MLYHQASWGFFVLGFAFLRMVLFSPHWLQTTDLPAFTSQVLGLQARAAASALEPSLNWLIPSNTFLSFNYRRILQARDRPLRSW